MRTITRRTEWRTLSDSEIEMAMPWMKMTHRYRMSVAIGLLVLFLIPALALPILHIIDNTFNEVIKFLWLYICAGFFIFIAVYFIVDYSRKMKCFKNGDFQAANVTVKSKAISSGYRTHYYSVTISGLYENDKAVKKKFRVPRWIYNRVSEGDRAYAVKYKYKKTKDPFVDLDFIPATEF